MSTPRVSPAVAVALGLVLLALFEPIDTTGSDGAILLLGAQAVADHGSLALDRYRDDPRCAYRLESDYRVVHSGSGLRYFLVGPPLISAPVVFVARRLGFDMLDQAQEFALQNLLSALGCGLCFLLLYALCRELLPERAALVVSVVTALGGPFVSTLATGLWPVAYALVPLLLATRHVVRHAEGRGRWRWERLAAAVLVALLCRPASVFFLVGLAAYGLARSRRAPSLRVLVPLGLLALGLGLALWKPLLAHLPWYYSPARLLPLTPVGRGLYGVLLSPGRGLLVFCPFAAVVLVAALPRLRALGRQPLFWFALAWASTHVLATACKSYWWGGNSFGPRVLAEVLIPLAVVTALLWRARTAPGAAPDAGLARLLPAYLAAGALAAAIHCGQALFNPAVQAWNRGSGRYLDTAVLFDWRYPQFLATAARVRARDLEAQERRLLPLRPGDGIEPESPRAVFVDWHALEGYLRRTGPDSHLRFRPEGFDARRDYLLELRVNALREQRLGLRLGDWSAEAVVTPPEPYSLRFVLPGRLLSAGGLHDLALQAPDAARASERDARVVGVSLYSARLAEVRPCPQVYYYSDDCLLQGFADAGAGGRWTRDRRAALRFSLPEAAPLPRRLQLTFRTLETQAVEVGLNGAPLAVLRGDGQELRRFSLEAAAAQLRPGENRLDFHLPEAHGAAGDERLLGLLLWSAEVEPLEEGARLAAFAVGADGDLPAPGDYDGDGRADPAVFSPPPGLFLAPLSGGGALRDRFGKAGDVPVSADYDGDGRTDVAIWRPDTAEFWIRGSRDGERRDVWGQKGDLPVIADYDGDRRADLALFRPAPSASQPALWCLRRSSDARFEFVPWGQPGDRPVRGDFDGLGRNGPAVFRARGREGVLLRRRSSRDLAALAWGRADDVPAPADYDGDGRTDFATWRPSDGRVAALLSSGGTWQGRLGTEGDLPLPADYDGDGRADFAVWRAGTHSYLVLFLPDRSARTRPPSRP